MLRLDKISKIYKSGDNVVHALKGVSIEFRKSEFVAVLGPSGCGKTTMLNIIGGLDRYDHGNLYIKDVSTKKYKDKDWDTYRNHSIGFVFQSYNLIPHLNILANVEIALTISGVSKKERRQKAIEALTKVGLADKLKNKPAQLSGGQMQRVAIARALVNNPEVVLADEPTGALDTESSIQIMELLKEVAKDRLVIMVTHNPDLANQYATRIVNLLDGELTHDSKPFTARDKKGENWEEDGKAKKKRMSFFTALSLSFKNLLTKKARTILVSIAGSIGIIGISLVSAISNGFQRYINKMQEDTLTSYPITINAKSVNMTSLLMSMIGGNNANKKIDHDKDAVYAKDQLTNIMDTVAKSVKVNNLEAFYAYLQEHQSELDDYINGIKYTYNLDLEYYTMDNSNVQPGSQALYKMIIAYSLFYFESVTNLEVVFSGGTYTINKKAETPANTVTPYWTVVQNYLGETYTDELKTNGTVTLSDSSLSSIISKIISPDGAMNVADYKYMNMGIFSEMIDNDELVKSQYDLVGTGSRFIQNENEVMVVLDKNSELDDYVLYSLGFLNDEEVNAALRAKIRKEKYQSKVEFSSIIGRQFRIVEDSDYYYQVGDQVVDVREEYEGNAAKLAEYAADILTNRARTVTVVGIARINDTTSSGSLSAGIVYSNKLTDAYITHHNNSLAVTSDTIRPINKGIPASINIYASSFASKDKIEKFIETYNAQAGTDDKISYTDYVSLIMSAVSTIINAITYVLIAFVAVSLLVSSIMIGVITYISVIERKKEIGVLRSVGASKRDVKRVFTAESFIIGLSSGGLGILVSVLLIIPINLLLKHFTQIGNLAALPVLTAIVLIVVSILLTFISGLIPARAAAKKDPVVALREM